MTKSLKMASPQGLQPTITTEPLPLHGVKQGVSLREAHRLTSHPGRRHYIERDAEIYRLVVLRGETLAWIGKLYCISPERVRMVVMREGFIEHGRGKHGLYGVRELRRFEKV